MENVTNVSIWKNNMNAHKSTFTGMHPNWTTKWLFLTLFRMGVGEYSPLLFPISFSPVTFTNVGTSSQNFWNFNFDPFSTLV